MSLSLLIIVFLLKILKLLVLLDVIVAMKKKMNIIVKNAHQGFIVKKIQLKIAIINV